MKKINLKRSDLNSLSKDEKQKLYIACTNFHAGAGCEIFFDHILNLYISSTLGLNKMRHDEAVTLITDDYFRGGVDMIQFIKAQIEEYAQAQDLSTPNVAQSATN